MTAMDRARRRKLVEDLADPPTVPSAAWNTSPFAWGPLHREA